MTIQNIKALLDACYQAKRARELLPALPKGVTPAYIHYLDTIELLEQSGARVKISDISEALRLPRPGVTRTVGNMERAGYLRKITSTRDGRITYLSVTEAGKQLSAAYNARFFARLAPELADISDADAAVTIRTIGRLYQVMSERSFFDESR